MRKAMVLAGGLPQIELIKELKFRGYYTILIDYTLHPIAEPYADKFYCESTLDIPTVMKIAIEEKIDIIITCCTDQAMLTVSIVAEKLGLPCYINEKIGKVATNKQYMKRMFKDNGIPTAKYAIVNNMEELKNFQYPLVVKPVDCNSSKGVLKVYDEDQAQKALMRAISLSRTHKAVIEEYIEGKEVSVDIFVENKKARILCTSISEKIADNKHFVIYKGRYPADIDKKIYGEIEKISQHIVDAINIVNGPMLIQYLIKDDKPYVIEYGARTGGCVKYRMIELASGVNVIKATVDLFDGKNPEITLKPFDGVIVDEFVYCKEGVLDHIEGMEDCLKSNSTSEIYVLKENKATFNKVTCSTDRVIAIVIVAQNYEEYVKKHNAIANSIKVIDDKGIDIMRHDLYPEI